jgi:hypothetical protein
MDKWEDFVRRQLCLSEFIFFVHSSATVGWSTQPGPVSLAPMILYRPVGLLLSSVLRELTMFVVYTVSASPSPAHQNTHIGTSRRRLLRSSREKEQRRYLKTNLSTRDYYAKCRPSFVRKKRLHLFFLGLPSLYPIPTLSPIQKIHSSPRNSLLPESPYQWLLPSDARWQQMIQKLR